MENLNTKINNTNPNIHNFNELNVIEMISNPNLENKIIKYEKMINNYNEENYSL